MYRDSKNSSDDVNQLWSHVQYVVRDFMWELCSGSVFEHIIAHLPLGGSLHLFSKYKWACECEAVLLSTDSSHSCLFLLKCHFMDCSAAKCLVVSCFSLEHNKTLPERYVFVLYKTNESHAVCKVTRDHCDLSSWLRAQIKSISNNSSASSQQMWVNSWELHEGGGASGF